MIFIMEKEISLSKISLIIKVVLKVEYFTAKDISKSMIGLFIMDNGIWEIKMEKES